MMRALSWSESGLSRQRLTSILESEFNRSNSGTSDIGKRSEASATECMKKVLSLPEVQNGNHMPPATKPPELATT
jgi:hypothetical protein